MVARLVWPVPFDKSIIHTVSEWGWVKKIGTKNSDYYSAVK